MRSTNRGARQRRQPSEVAQWQIIFLLLCSLMAFAAAGCGALCDDEGAYTSNAFGALMVAVSSTAGLLGVYLMAREAAGVQARWRASSARCSTSSSPRQPPPSASSTSVTCSPPARRDSRDCRSARQRRHRRRGPRARRRAQGGSRARSTRRFARQRRSASGTTDDNCDGGASPSMRVEPVDALECDDRDEGHGDTSRALDDRDGRGRALDDRDGRGRAGGDLADTLSSGRSWATCRTSTRRRCSTSCCRRSATRPVSRSTRSSTRSSPPRRLRRTASPARARADGRRGRHRADRGRTTTSRSEPRAEALGRGRRGHDRRVL